VRTERLDCTILAAPAAVVIRVSRPYVTPEYVNIYAPTLGRDFCRPVGSRWIETFAPEGAAAPVHPNAADEAAMAGAVDRGLFRHTWHR
jgi:hypothetical protein